MSKIDFMIFAHSWKGARLMSDLFIFQVFAQIFDEFPQFLFYSVGDTSLIWKRQPLIFHSRLFGTKVLKKNPWKKSDKTKLVSPLQPFRVLRWTDWWANVSRTFDNQFVNPDWTEVICLMLTRGLEPFRIPRLFAWK